MFVKGVITIGNTDGLKKKNTMVRIFYLLLIIMPIIDFLNGLSEYFGIPQVVGQLYRIFFIFFLLLSILTYSEGIDRWLMIVYFVSSFLFLLILLQTLFYQTSINHLFGDVSVILKFLLSIYIIEFTRRFWEFVDIGLFKKVISNYALIFPILMIVPYFMGVGNITYHNTGGGFKSFFTATNDITVVFLVLNIYTGYEFFNSIIRRDKVLKNGVKYLLNITSLILIGTKTGLVCGFLLFFYFWLKYVLFNFKVSIFSRIKILFFSALTVLIFLLGFKEFFLAPILDSYERFQYFYTLYEDDLVQFITSSRSVFFDEALNNLLNESLYWVRILFGSGFTYRMENWGIGDTIEMDMFDTFFSLGLLGLLIPLIYYFRFFLFSVREVNKDVFALTFIIVVLYSFFAGHVLYSALCSTLLGIICSVLLLKKRT